MSIGENIKKIRMQKGITRQDLADSLEVANSTISRYENNLRKPDIETINKISQILGVSVDELIGKPTKMDAVTFLNRINNSNMSEVEMAKSIIFDSGFSTRNTFEGSSLEEKNNKINNLIESNSLNLKIQNYIDNFDNFTKEDLMDISYNLNNSFKEIINKFIIEYHDEDIKIYSRRFLETYTLVQLTTKANEKSNEIIESYKSKLNAINDILNSTE